MHENRASVTDMERSLAAFAHATGMMIGPGVLISAVIWALHRRKSRFVTYHALQALAYQIAALVFICVSGGCLTCFNVLAFFPITIAAERGSSIPPLLAWLSVFGAVGFVGVILVCALYAAVAAVLVRRGYDFKYPILGSLVERYVKRH